MTRPRKRDVKPDFLRFIDLLYYCRDQEIGKRGCTRIRLIELQNKLIGGDQLNEFITRLVADSVIQPPERIFDVRINDHGNFFQTTGEIEIELYCNLTKEELLQYRFSLTKTPQGQRVFNAPSWETVHIHIKDGKNALVSISQTDVLDVPVTYGTLGFVNSKNGKPSKVWEFFLILAKHNGDVAKNHPDIVGYGGETNKHKQAVMELLQKTFGLPDDDPFETVKRRNATYRLKFRLTLERPQSDNAHSQERSPFDDEMSRYTQ